MDGLCIWEHRIVYGLDTENGALVLVALVSHLGRVSDGTAINDRVSWRWEHVQHCMFWDCDQQSQIELWICTDMGSGCTYPDTGCGLDCTQ